MVILKISNTKYITTLLNNVNYILGFSLDLDAIALNN